MRINLLRRRPKPSRQSMPVARPAPTDDRSEAEWLRELADSYSTWWHSIDFGHGVVTRGHKSAELIRAEIEAFRFPDLHGKTVLDIGAWDGVYSFEAERRGAKRVVAMDHYVWSLDLTKTEPYRAECKRKGIRLPEWHTIPEIWQPERLPGKRGFDTARRALRSKVESVVADFMEVAPGSLGTFDVVLFFGVLYHMKNPLAALERVAALTKEMAIVETAAIVVPGMEDAAMCEFYETDELAGGPTNWWAPNRKALEGLCRAAGFREAKVLSTPPAEDSLPARQVHRCRLVAHAWK